MQNKSEYWLRQERGNHGRIKKAKTKQEQQRINSITQTRKGVGGESNGGEGGDSRSPFSPLNSASACGRKEKRPKPHGPRILAIMLNYLLILYLKIRVQSSKATINNTSNYHQKVFSQQTVLPLFLSVQHARVTVRISNSLLVTPFGHPAMPSTLMVPTDGP